MMSSRSRLLQMNDLDCDRLFLWQERDRDCSYNMLSPTLNKAQTRMLRAYQSSKPHLGYSDAANSSFKASEAGAWGKAF